MTELPADDLGPTGGVSPEEAAQHAEELHRLKVALDALAPPEREAVLLRDFEGLPFAVLAERLSRPSADAARKLHDRACEKLARLLGADAE